MSNPSFSYATAPGSVNLKAVGLLYSVLVLSAAAHAGDLTVRIQNIKEDKGNLMVALYANETDFNKTPIAAHQVKAALRSPDGSIQVSFVDMPAGNYAVSAFHDRNADGKLDVNLMGVPTEPFGFANSATGSFGPPSFKDASVAIGAETVRTPVTLK